tara:strand:- start:769 stop:957 length:189 start_codon:yes stop_codon:yes gene_type:complete
MEFIVITWLATVVPNRDQYYCILEKTERELCIYWCGNKRKGFNWFEVKPQKGCKIKKKFYAT